MGSEKSASCGLLAHTLPVGLDDIGVERGRLGVEPVPVEREHFNRVVVPTATHTVRVDTPVAEHRDPVGRPQALLVFCKCHLAPLRLGNVLTGADLLHDVAAVVHDRPADFADKAHVAVRQHDAVFQFEVAAGAQLGEGRPYRVDVLRMREPGQRRRRRDVLVGRHAVDARVLFRAEHAAIGLHVPDVVAETRDVRRLQQVMLGRVLRQAVRVEFATSRATVRDGRSISRLSADYRVA